MTAPTPPSPEKRALIDAYETVLKAEAERRDTVQASTPAGPPRTRPIAWIVLGLVLAGLIAAVVLRPPWLGLGVPLREPPAVREASLRLAVALEAQRVMRYQREQGRLPATLDEAGPVLAGVSYQPSREGIYEMSATDGEIAVLYRSTTSLREFVGNSSDIVSRRTR